LAVVLVIVDQQEILVALEVLVVALVEVAGHLLLVVLQHKDLAVVELDMETLEAILLLVRHIVVALVVARVAQVPMED
jgi:hypothetical protein